MVWYAHNMEKITPAVIIALILGAVLGYIIKGTISPSQNPQTSQEAIAPKESAKPQAKAGSKEEKIQNALSAATEAVSKNATIMDWPEKEGGDLIELQKGTSDWTCLPDTPSSPGNDPICVDKQGMQFFQAYMSQKPTNLTQAGLGYMLQGGSDPSNTDPFATKPAEGEEWVSAPAHLMVFPVGKLDQTVYSTDPKNGGPWIMWAGTPYEHLMIPVK